MERMRILNTQRKIVFDIYQYKYGNQEMNPEFKELRDYMEQYKIAVHENEILLSGRACLDIEQGNKLHTEAGEVLTVKEIFAYGRSFEIVREGMTCAVLIGYTAHSFAQFEKLYDRSENSEGD